VDPGAGIYAVEKREITVSARNRTPAVQHVARRYTATGTQAYGVYCFFLPFTNHSRSSNEPYSSLGAWLDVLHVNGLA
jgi:hypothetical protein